MTQVATTLNTADTTPCHILIWDDELDSLLGYAGRQAGTPEGSYQAVARSEFAFIFRGIKAAKIEVDRLNAESEDAEMGLSFSVEEA